MNVALVRVLYAHALVAAPRLALGRLAPLGRVLGDPRLGMAGVFLSLRRVLPDRYPLDRDVERYIAEEQRLGRMLDYAVIVPRLQRLYEWSAEELAEPRLLELVRDGNPIYAWPFEERHVWRSPDAVRGPRTGPSHRSQWAPDGVRPRAIWMRPHADTTDQTTSSSRKPQSFSSIATQVRTSTAHEVQHQVGALVRREPAQTGSAEGSEDEQSAYDLQYLCHASILVVDDHIYSAELRWSGSTALGWERYDRAHTGTAPPAEQELVLTTGEAKGDPRQLNPEQLLVMAASSCQLLWFLHLAAKARIDVVEYEDSATGVMPTEVEPTSVTEIVLRPGSSWPRTRARSASGSSSRPPTSTATSPTA